MLKKSLIVTAISCAAVCANAQAPLALRSERRNDAAISAAAFPASTPGDPRAKSKFFAAVYSLLLPGMGELYAGDYDRGRYFTAGEGVAWIAYTGMLLYGKNSLRDARTYAAIHSGAQVAGKPDQFFTNVGNFLNTDAYNDKKARDGNFNLVYFGSDYQWQWDADASRDNFRTMLVRGNGIVDGTKYIVAAIVLNHIVSAVDAVLAVGRHNAHLSAGVERDVLGYNTSVRIELGL
jgi:hypothetical protein